MLGVIFGFTTMLAIINFGLINIFNLYPIIQKILIGTGTIFLIYLSYKISFSKSSDKNDSLKPVNFSETFFYQFLNPKDWSYWLNHQTIRQTRIYQQAEQLA